jgi:ethanolamine permease
VSITQDESSDYLSKRTLKRGSAGWLLLAGLGVSYVISGDYSAAEEELE